ncbi:MAG: hypothetical protein ABIQ39_16110 [Ilumatobacteraceae bacterium]
MSAAGILFVVSNLTITAGYVFLAFAVVPRVTVRLRRTKIGGIGFFLLCGLHHADNVFHYMYQGNETVSRVFAQLHMILIDVPQAIFVWMFVTGLYIELVRWGPWGQLQDETSWDQSQDLERRQAERRTDPTPAKD